MMRLRVVPAVIGMVVGLWAAGGPAGAVDAGDFCANALAGTITTADNGATVRCDFNPTSNRHHWVVIPTPTTAPPTTAGPGRPTTSLPPQTGILSSTGGAGGQGGAGGAGGNAGQSGGAGGPGGQGGSGAAATPVVRVLERTG